MTVSKITRIVIAASAVAATFFIMHTLVIGGWSFDMLSARHWGVFAHLFLTGKILTTRYIAMMFVIIGCAAAGWGVAWVALSFAPKYVPPPPPRPEPVPEPEPVVEEEEDLKPHAELYASMKAAEMALQPAQVVEPAPVLQSQPVAAPAPVPAAPSNDERERVALQAKIQEVMDKMKAREGGPPVTSPPPPPPRVEIPPQPTRLAKSPVVPGPEPELELEEEPIAMPASQTAPAYYAPSAATAAGLMNYAAIPPELNQHLERILLGAGFQLLTEIRIGETGIDYLGIGKDEIFIMQVDVSNGAFMASEDLINGRAQWMNDKESKLSPVSRALTARDDLKRLIGTIAPMPMTPSALLVGNSVLNEMEAARDWKRRGVRVMNLSELVKTYPIESIEKVDESLMQKIIPILEAAESP